MSCTKKQRRETRYKIRDRIMQRQSECKGALKVTRSMGKGLHKVFSMVVKDIYQELTPLGDYGSEFSHFIPEPRNFSEVKNYQRTTLAKVNSQRDKESNQQSEFPN